MQLYVLHLCHVYMYTYNVYTCTCKYVPVSLRPVVVSVLRSMAFLSESVKPSLSATAASQLSRYPRKVFCSHCEQNQLMNHVYIPFRAQQCMHNHTIITHVTYRCNCTLKRKSLGVRYGCWNRFHNSGKVKCKTKAKTHAEYNGRQIVRSRKHSLFKERYTKRGARIRQKYAYGAPNTSN